MGEEATPRDQESGAITPELVQQVAARVYALWRRDLERLRERSGARRRGWRQERRR